MSRHANHRQPSPWLLAMTVGLAFAPGCSIEPEPAGELISYINGHGTISVRWVPKGVPAPPAPTVAPAPPPAIDLSQIRAEAKERQRRIAEAEQEARRQRLEQFRDDQRYLDAYQRTRQSIVNEQRYQEQQRNREFQDQQRRQFENQRLRYNTDAGRWQEVSKPASPLPSQDQGPAGPILQQWQQDALRLGR
jgi:hypothetical protein